MSQPLRRVAAVCCAVVSVAVASAPLSPATATPATTERPIEGGVVTAVTGPSADDSPPMPMPSDPDGLPAPVKYGDDIDRFASYQGQSACASAPSPGVVQLRALALKTYGRGGTSPAYTRACTSGGTSEHKDGRAWDWMLNYYNRADRRAAADFLSWLTGPGPSGVRGEMAARLGVMYVIYNNRSWSSYSRTWKTYSGYDPHTSHIHISLSWNGARANTSFWSGRTWAVDQGPCQFFANQPAVAPTLQPRIRPCPEPAASARTSSLSLAWIGSAGDDVARAQRGLDVPVTRSFDATTQQAVLRFQRRHDLPRTGALDKPTWASLRPASATLAMPDWTPVEAIDWARTTAGSPHLHRNSAGKGAYALQVALRLPEQWQTGFFGRRTARSVVAFKQEHGLPANSTVGPKVWSALADG